MMTAWLLAVALFGLAEHVPEGAPIAVTDLAAGRQAVSLRAPLVARTAGTRLVLFVRALQALGGTGDARRSGFESALPPGSVRAWLRSADGQVLELAHTDYVYFRGFAGLVLGEVSPGRGGTRYDTLEIDTARDLPAVRFMWLDQRTRSVRDFPAPR